MAATELRAAVRHRGDVAVVDLTGDVDRSAAPVLQEAWTEAAQAGGPVLLNFEQVGYINSTGIAVIVGVLARARAEHRELAVYGLSEHYRQIFTITRLSDFVGLYPDEETAVGETGHNGGSPVRTIQGGNR
jgi:anti-anti-sigma factor